MIFRIVDIATGVIVMSLDVASSEAAQVYLKPGQTLMTGGDQLSLDDGRLFVADGRLERKPGPPLPFEPELRGLGESVSSAL
ncbi:hypothetical protein [Brevundimonas sp.]|uniref:hypothetical protein n=1 Tax=Brevundimonas sp. TaxID=1871086 RepID=UPI0028ACDC8F|nr:hypothetical protein [Brevundimonas sp.]